MATVTATGEVLTAIAEEEQDESRHIKSTEFGSLKKYVPYNPNDKSTTVGVPRMSQKAGSDSLNKNEGNVTDAATTTVVDKLPSASDDDNDDGVVHESSLAISNVRSDEESVYSVSTPINFNDPVDPVDEGSMDSDDRESNASSLQSIRLHVSNRNLGMTAAQMQESQRIISDQFDQRIDDDAERDIVNVRLEASAFADRERLNLSEDIYSFILACSFFSIEFWFAIYFIFVKYLCYYVIAKGTGPKFTEYEGESSILPTKIIMIPVAVAMQEDLITVYYNLANKKYDALTYKRNAYATEFKWKLSNALRAVDGLMSLGGNLCVLLSNEQMAIFLSFAGLHYLQFIDDVIYELAEMGFFGQSMEQATIACKVITFTRRATTKNKCNNFITNLDTVLFALTIVTCYVTYIIIVAVVFDEDNNWSSGFRKDKTDLAIDPSLVL